ncbi:ABC transporter ATP-binding protein [Dongia soli]|uniref:Glutathione import ATP-binding protein GsiA n=2 Tax=Dongia soli TaxID=600628 RepID=A0ABU5EAW0_9PROT|nr:ABC transporter ATP-binding protein [Dongia soli]MDY0883498.1 ABC transporter ATP-binding protein [Dongia soli]
MIAVRDLTVSFGTGKQEVAAVKQVSFQVDKGESFGLVGESGSGKSTVLRVLAGLNPTWQGKVVIARHSLAARRGKNFFKTVQMVFQDPYGSLHPKHTVDRILSEPLAVHGIKDAESKVRAVLDQVQLGSSFRFRYPHQLSGGQRQRVAIARALILRPQVVLLDEPTSALDVSIQAEILNLLAELRRDLGLTYLLVSHDLAVVGQMCSRLALMRKGEIVELADAAQLAAGNLTHPYSRQLLVASKGYDRAAIDAFADF